MKIRMFFRRMLLALLVVLCLGPGNGVLALSKPSQAGQKVLSGGQRDFRWPVPGAYNLSSCFLDYRRHYAIDIAADSGTTVIASYPGTVVATYTGCRHNYGKSYNCCDSGFGNYVVLKHDYTLKSGEHITLYSQYAHLTSVSVSAGQRVSTGTKVGTVGSTGYSTGPHLDYQILKGGYRPFRDYSIDPYINELLELPKGLHTTFGGCCQDYVAYVKKLYPHCTHGRFNAQGKCTDCDYYYNWKSTKSPAVMGNYKVNAAVTPKKIPYSAAENAAQTLSAGATVSVSASYTNGSGERWYALTANGADFGYVPKSAVTFSSYWESQYSGKITAPSNEQTLKQQSYTLKGTVSSRYPLRKVSGYLDGKCYATWSGSGSATSLDFTGTDINNKLFFSKLTPGKHTLTITAADATGRGETKIAECVFYIQAPPSIHTVTLEFCDGTTQAQTLQRQDGYALGSLPTPEKEGYLLDGWFTEAEGGTQVTEDSAVTKSMTLYAQWTPLAHTVTMEDTQLSVSHHANPRAIENRPPIFRLVHGKRPANYRKHSHKSGLGSFPTVDPHILSCYTGPGGRHGFVEYQAGNLPRVLRRNSCPYTGRLHLRRVVL